MVQFQMVTEAKICQMHLQVLNEVDKNNFYQIADHVLPVLIFMTRLYISELGS